MTSYYNNGRILWLDILKSVAIIAMILLHVSAVGLSEAKVGSYEWQVSNIFNSFCRFCVPVFIMIFGAIFLNREMSMKKYIKRLTVAVVFWSTAYTLYASIPQLLSDRIEMLSFVRSLCSPTHLWFLWMILPLYLAVPIFRAIVKDKLSLKYFLLLWIAFGILIPAMKHLPIIGELISSIVSQTHFFLVLEYGGYFVLGYYLTNHRVPCVDKYSLIYIWGGIITTIIGSFMLSSSLEQTSELFLGYMFPTTCLTGVGLFIYFKNCVSRWKISPQMLNVVSFVSACSLGVYAVHMFFLAAFHKIGLTYAVYNPIISIPLICIVTLLLSMGVVYLIKYFIPGSKYLI